MNHKAIAAAVALTFASALGISHVAAQDFTSSSPMDQLGEFVGDGTCTGQVMAMGKDPAHATTGKYHGEKTLDGHWVVVHYDEDQTATNPKPFHVQQYFSYDPAKKRFIAVAFDNASPGYSMGISPGWKGDTLTVDETQQVAGKTVVFRDSFTRSGSNMSRHVGTMRDKHGKWIKTDEENCKSA